MVVEKMLRAGVTVVGYIVCSVLVGVVALDSARYLGEPAYKVGLPIGMALPCFAIVNEWTWMLVPGAVILGLAGVLTKRWRARQPKLKPRLGGEHRRQR